MKRILLTALLIVTANTASALQLSIKHNKDLPTPHELITKGTILDKHPIKQGTMAYFVAWDKTDDIYWCILNGRDRAYVQCQLAIQETK
jgi:hypothetical protein